MADDGQERSEEPTGKRLSDAREKGQLPRSKELSTVVVLLTAGAAFIFIGGYMLREMEEIMRGSFTLDPALIHDPDRFTSHFLGLMNRSLNMLFPFFLAMVVAGIASALLLSGWNFSTQALAPKIEKLDPIKGMGKIFTWRGLVEMIKALVKFSIVAVAAIIYVNIFEGHFVGLGKEDLLPAMAHAADLLLWVFLVLSSTLIIVAAVDIPYQLWDHTRQLKMSKQEVKEEGKQTEGSPEIKGRQRQIQFQMHQKRMMEAVPKADVVITNPTHFAVALRYEGGSMGAPLVVAKGVDYLAQRIREIAKEHHIPVITAPPLSRAIYYSTEVDSPIPEGLYRAVAQVLAYVYHLRRGDKVQAEKMAKSMHEMPIPDDLRRDG
ncbi:MAG: flagellar biosynthesis protein FlhB [Gammaproteobacteria bacterium]|nr:flagellar biosynthesis protein FlhB [Gammaproteobacteria bacterium]